MSRPVCKFFQQGNCRYGEGCRFEHPRNTGISSQNRFGALGGRNARGNDDRKETSFSISTADVYNDMTAGKGRPQWILSTYGPGKSPPASLLEGNEYSFEELRVRYYELASANNSGQADQEALTLWTKAQESMRNIANNADDVIKFMDDAAKKHPNRFDFCQTDGRKTREEIANDAESKNSSSGASKFGAGTSFGQPAAFSTFGKPAFGQAASSSGFGQSGFGQPAQPASANPFAQPSSTGLFGKPALEQVGEFHQPSQPTSGFGQPSQPMSAFGQSSQPLSAFGQPAQASGFGQTGFGQQKASGNPFAAPSAASGFGQTGFGQKVSANPFAAPSAASGFGQASQPAAGGFGQPSRPTSTFGQPAQPSGFGQASPFGQPAQSASVSGFGQPSQPASNAFGQPAQPAGSPFGQPRQPSSNGFGQPAQPVESGFGQPALRTSTGFGQRQSSGFVTTSAPALGSTPATANPFGQPSTTQNANPFVMKSSSASPFGQTAQSTGGFGQPSTTTISASPFGTTAGPTSPPSTGFGANSHAQSSSSVSHPLTNKSSVALTYTETLPNHASNIHSQGHRVSSYAGRRVQYIKDAPCYDRPDGKGWERIWFPENGKGVDVVALSQPEKKGDLEASESDYTEGVREAFAKLFGEGGFGKAGLPRVPPLREWCAFDF